MTTLDYILLGVVFLILYGAHIKNVLDDAPYFDEETNRFMSKEEYNKLYNNDNDV